MNAEPVTPVTGVASKCFGCKSTSTRSTAENSSATAFQSSIENPVVLLLKGARTVKDC